MRELPGARPVVLGVDRAGETAARVRGLGDGGAAGPGPESAEPPPLTLACLLGDEKTDRRTVRLLTTN
ncbi:hypothetical protein FAIPA1_210063 [Frankia sp. AiPs1]